MKRYLGILLLVVISISTWAAHPSYQSEGHYFGMYANGAYSMMPIGIADVRNRGGYALGGGLLYEYEYNAFLMNIGCGFTWQTAGWGLRDNIYFADRNVIDTQGTEYVLHTSLSRQDIIKRGFMEVPLLFGGQRRWFYALGGIKIGIGLLDHSFKFANITTFGEYDRYFTPIHDADNHAFRTNVLIEQLQTLVSQIDIRLSCEIGSWLGSIETRGNIGVKARLALFADYGVFTTKVQLNSSFIENRVGNYDFAKYQLQPILAINGSHLLGNLLVGLKLTVLIGGEAYSSTYDCPTCHILDDRYRKIRVKKKCVICNE